MDKRLITTSPLFRLARLVVPEHLLLQWFGRKVPVRCGEMPRRGAR